MVGPFPYYDHLGSIQAMMVIMISMGPGKGPGDKAKVGTAQKARSTYTIIWDISPEAGADIAILINQQHKGLIHSYL